MRSTALARIALFLLTGAAGLSLGLSCNDPLPPNARPGQGSQLFTSPQANPVALSCDGELVYVANTTSGTLSIIETAGTNRFVAEIAVGLDPVGVAVRPKLDCADALEDEQVFVTNHVSDSIAVVSRSTATVLQVIQELDGDGVTRTDEPVGVVFASRDEAYVTLDDANEVVKLTPDAGGNWAIAERSSDAGNQVFTAQAPRALAAGAGRIRGRVVRVGQPERVPVVRGVRPSDLRSRRSERRGLSVPAAHRHAADVRHQPEHRRRSDPRRRPPRPRRLRLRLDPGRRRQRRSRGWGPCSTAWPAPGAGSG